MAISDSSFIPISIGDAIPTLRLKWHAALPPGERLPPYEQVVLGSLGRLADRLMLVRTAPGADAQILQAGRAVGEWLGCDVHGKPVRDLPPESVVAVREAIRQALDSCAPAYSSIHRARDGIVETYELLALPMSCRWGAPLVAIYVEEQRARYNLVDAIFRSTEDGILALAAIRDTGGHVTDFQIVALNDATLRQLHTRRDDLLWRRFSELTSGLNSPGMMQRLASVHETGRPDQIELLLSFGEDVAFFRVGISAVDDLISITLADIGEMKRREESIKLLFDGNPVPMWLFDPESLNFLSVNDAAVVHYGYPRERFVAMQLPDIWPEDEREAHLRFVQSIGASYESGRSWRHLRADGSEIEVLTYGRRLTFNGRIAVLVCVIDVTERRQAEARIAYMAHHDALTGLPNRARFGEYLEETLTRAGRGGAPLAVICLDLDQFKSVNDSLGHPIGDELLRAVAARLTRGVSADDLVARLGGDEFAIVVPNAGPDAAGALAGRVVTALGLPYNIQGHEIVGGASVGIALAPGDGMTAEALLRNADMALYRAKFDGRGRFRFFEADMDRRVQSRRALELDLRKAYSNGEFELFYQPLINVRSNEVSGFEALLRWRHPARGMISPAEFIPLAEEIGLIVPIGEWVLREACNEAMKWPGYIKVAVNLSPVQFRSKGLVQAVMTALAYSRLPAHRLELEITESVLLAETDVNLATLHRLREIGVHISMDDFGTGYSSLSYLRSFPFDKIKIDQSFVRELAERPDCMAIIKAVAGLGISLGISTTAEGVETEAQLDRLRAEGCTEVQGFFFSPPKPSSEVPALLAKYGERQVRVA